MGTDFWNETKGVSFQKLVPIISFSEPKKITMGFLNKRYGTQKQLPTNTKILLPEISVVLPQLPSHVLNI